MSEERNLPDKRIIVPLVGRDGKTRWERAGVMWPVRVDDKGTERQSGQFTMKPFKDSDWDGSFMLVPYQEETNGKARATKPASKPAATPESHDDVPF